MTFDLRARYAFDSSEGQIPEGQDSVYGPANSHANCVPASFTAALALAGYEDIDPQRITNEVYGPNYRGGFGNFERTIAWICANVPNPPRFSEGGFDFAAAEAAGQAAQLIIVAGWIDAPSVTFVAESKAAGFSHASLMVAHLAGEKFVIWNTWTGQLQTYDRSVLAVSLYEMSIISGGQHGPLLGGDIDMATGDEIQAHLNNQDAFLVAIGKGLFGTDTGYPPNWQNGKANPTLIELIQAIKPGSVIVDESAVLAAIADLKAHPDPTAAAIGLRIENALKSA